MIIYDLYRWRFLKGVSDYFDPDLCLAKVKIDDKFKSMAFDERNNRLAVISFDRAIYYFEIP